MYRAVGPFRVLNTQVWYINRTFLYLSNADFISCRGRWNSVTQTQKIVHYCCFLISIQILADLVGSPTKMWSQWPHALLVSSISQSYLISMRIFIVERVQLWYESFCIYITGEMSSYRSSGLRTVWNRLARTLDLSLVFYFAWLRSWLSTLLQQKKLSTSRKNMTRGAEQAFY